MPITLPAWTPWRTRFPGGVWQNAPGKRLTPISAEAMDNLETGILGARQALSSVIAIQDTETAALDAVEADLPTRVRYDRLASSVGLTVGSRDGTDPLLSVHYGTTANTAVQGNDARILKAGALPDSPSMGDMLVWDGASWSRLAKGADGQVFVSQAGFPLPRWAANPGALPAASVKGTITYYDGTSWTLLLPPSGTTTDRQTLRPDPLQTGLAWTIGNNTEIIQSTQVQVNDLAGAWTPSNTATATRNTSRVVSITSAGATMAATQTIQFAPGRVVLFTLPIGLRPGATVPATGTNWPWVSYNASDNIIRTNVGFAATVNSAGAVGIDLPATDSGQSVSYWKATPNHAAGVGTFSYTATS